MSLKAMEPAAMAAAISAARSEPGFEGVNL